MQYNVVFCGKCNQVFASTGPGYMNKLYQNNAPQILKLKKNKI